MGKPYQLIVEESVQKSDVILLVLDSRFSFETRNDYLEELVSSYNRELIYVINKCDLVPIEYMDKVKYELHKATNRNVIFVSSTKRFGSKFLRVELSKTLKRLKRNELVVSVIGYPNVGKSSVINLLKGKHVAKASLQSGFTKSSQLVRISKKIFLIDTPGILDTDDEVLLGLINAINADKIKEPLTVAKKIFDIAKKSLLEYYAIDNNISDFDVLLKSVAKKFNKVLKGNLFDLDFAARRIIKDWQIGNITIR